MPTTGFEVRLTEGRGRAEVARFAETLDEIARSLREIDHIYLGKGKRAIWVMAAGVSQDRDRDELVVRLEARPRSSERTAEDMLRPVEALVSGAARLAEVPEVPVYFSPTTVGRLGELATPHDGVQQAVGLGWSVIAEQTFEQGDRRLRDTERSDALRLRSGREGMREQFVRAHGRRADVDAVKHDVDA